MFDIFNISKIITIIAIAIIFIANIYFYVILKRNYRLQEELTRQKQKTEQRVQKQKIKDFEEKQEEKKESIIKEFKKDENVSKKSHNKIIIDTSNGKHTLVF